MTRKDRWHGVGPWEKTTATITWVAASAAMMALLLISCSEATPKPDPVVSIADTRIPESDGGPTEAEFSVVLTPASEQIVTVDYTTEDGTAEAGKDYAATSGTLTFAAGETTKTINVAILDDALVEPYEALAVTLSNPSNARLADAMATGTVTNDDTKIYYAASGWERGAPTTILRANLDGTELEPLTPDLGVDVRGVALDIAGGSDKVYWTVYWPDGEVKIQRANLDGSDVETVLIPNCNPWGISLDAASGKMYWTSCGIWRANLDGSNAEHLVVDEVNMPIGIALDLTAGKMYWTDRGDTGTGEGNIKRANLDGSDVEIIVDLTHWPSGISVDTASGKMYWTSTGDRGRIVQRANLDGSDIEELVSAGGALGIALDIDEGKMYWTEFRSGKIQRTNLDGSHVEDLVTEPGSFPNGIALALR